MRTDEKVASADQTRVRRCLERDRDGVDALLDNFSTYQVARTYRWADPNARVMPDDANLLEQEVTIVQLLGGNVDSVTEWKLEQLRRAGDSTLREV